MIFLIKSQQIFCSFCILWLSQNHRFLAISPWIGDFEAKSDENEKLVGKFLPRLWCTKKKEVCAGLFSLWSHWKLLKITKFPKDRQIFEKSFPKFFACARHFTILVIQRHYVITRQNFRFWENRCLGQKCTYRLAPLYSTWNLKVVLKESRRVYKDEPIKSLKIDLSTENYVVSINFSLFTIIRLYLLFIKYWYIPMSQEII